MIEEACEELRHSTVLQDPLIDKKIVLDCKRFTQDSNRNELVVSVYVKDRSIDVAVVLANYMRYETKVGTVLYALNHTTTNVYVRRYNSIQYEGGESKFRINL